MRRNARKLKPNPTNNLRCNSSIRGIIGDRRFNQQFGHLNSTETEVVNKTKRMKVGDAEVHNLPNLGRIASSDHSESTGDPKGICRDFAAKTSEYAFFKKMKENTCSNVVHVHANCHDNQLSNVQQSDHFTREEIQNVQKENIQHAKPSIPNEKEKSEVRYSFLSPPCCGSKISAVSNVFGADDTNVQNVKPSEYNWLTPSVSSKINNSGNKSVFSAKREKLRHLAAERYSYNVNELSSEGFDLVSALISRILPVVHDGNSDHNQDKTDSSYKLPHFSESEPATQLKSHETYKGKLIKFQDLSYLDDGFSRLTEKPVDKNLLEWDPSGSESFSYGQLSNSSSQYNHCHTEGYKRNLTNSDQISYLDDCFFRSTRKPVDTSILEWNPTGLESCIQYDLADGFRIQNFDMERMLTFDEPHSMHESRNFQELEESRFYNEPKLLEQPPWPQPLLLGWDCNSETDDPFLTSSTSPNSSPYVPRHLKESHLLTSSIATYTPKHLMALDDFSIKFPLQDYKSEEHESVLTPSASLNSSRYITSHLKEGHLLTSSILPYTPNHLMAVEDCSIKFPVQDYSFEHRGSEPFLFVIESPAGKSLSFLNTGLRSIADDDETEEKFVYSSDMLLDGRMSDYNYMESFADKHFDHIEYPLLLSDSSRSDGF